MNNDENKNLNGFSSNDINNSMPSSSLNNNSTMDEIETLDINPTPSQPIIEGGTFFNAPNQNNANDMVSNMPLNNNMNLNNNIEPAYSNPQNIVPNMPGFESSSSIGVTPPISLDAEKKPKKEPSKNKKILFLILILVLIAGIGFGIYYVLNYTNLFSNIQTNNIKISINNIELDLGQSLPDDLKDYATITGTDAKNCQVDKTKIDTTKAGEYEFSVKCGDKVEKGKVTIIDNTLNIETVDVYKKVGETIDAKEFDKNPQNNLTYSFLNQEDVNKYLTEAGIYDVTIKVVSNENDNKNTEVKATLYVTNYDLTGYFVCSTQSQAVSGSSATMTASNRFSIANSGESNVYGGITFEEYKFVFTDESEYSNYLANYNTGSQIIINGINSNNIVFDNDTKTITMTNPLKNEELYTQYGEDKFQTYGSLRQYFMNELKQSCVYERK